MADATATAFYVLTASGDIPTAAAALKIEANIDAATFVYGTVESPVGDSRVGEIKVEASHATAASTAEGYITAAATSVGGLTLKPAAGKAAPNGIALTADAPTLTTDAETPSQQEGGIQVVVTLTSTNDYGAGSTVTIKETRGGPASCVFADVGDGTATWTINSVTGDAGVYNLEAVAIDGLGQEVVETVVLTITAP